MVLFPRVMWLGIRCKRLACQDHLQEIIRLRTMRLKMFRKQGHHRNELIPHKFQGLCDKRESFVSTLAAQTIRLPLRPDLLLSMKEMHLHDSFGPL